MRKSGLAEVKLLVTVLEAKPVLSPSLSLQSLCFQSPLIVFLSMTEAKYHILVNLYS